MLEKLATHDIQDVAELFSLADKCARAAESRARHTSPAPEARKGAKPDVSAAAQGGSNNNNKKKKADGNNQPLAKAPTTTVATARAGGGRGPRGNKHPCQASCSNDRGVDLALCIFLVRKFMLQFYVSLISLPPMLLVLFPMACCWYKLHNPVMGGSCLRYLHSAWRHVV
jgi:hypothetical protein